jgi:ribosomal protein L11 methyltransferase
VTANLFSELLIAALPKFRKALRPRGSIILSGILREQASDVIAAMPRVGFEVKTKRCRGKWVALACRRFALRSAEEDTA